MVSTVNPLPGVETDGYMSTGLQLCHAMLCHAVLPECPTDRLASSDYFVPLLPIDFLRLSSKHLNMSCFPCCHAT